MKEMKPERAKENTSVGQIQPVRGPGLEYGGVL